MGGSIRAPLWLICVFFYLDTVFLRERLLLPSLFLLFTLYLRLHVKGIAHDRVREEVSIRLASLRLPYFSDTGHAILFSPLRVYAHVSIHGERGVMRTARASCMEYPHASGTGLRSCVLNIPRAGTTATHVSIFSVRTFTAPTRGRPEKTAPHLFFA